jgi:hypothetical protein
VEIISLAHAEGQLVFVQLASLAGLSHIRVLHGDLIGCAMSKDVSIPHLVNWRTKAMYALAEFPDENVSQSLVDQFAKFNFPTRAVVWPSLFGRITLSLRDRTISSYFLHPLRLALLITFELWDLDFLHGM